MGTWRNIEALHTGDNMKMKSRQRKIWKQVRRYALASYRSDCSSRELYLILSCPVHVLPPKNDEL
jgi:hypothetical protein